MNKENQDDDGFWEGEFNGRIGVFPSVLVEELSASENGDTQWVREIQVSGGERSGEEAYQQWLKAVSYTSCQCDPHSNPEKIILTVSP